MLFFEHGYDSPQVGTVLLSFAAAILSLFLASSPPSARKTGARAVAIALLAVLSSIQDGPLLLAAGLLVFAAGQAFLVQDDDRATGIGLICHSVGQSVCMPLLIGFVRFTDVVVSDWSLISGALILIAAALIFAKTVGFAVLRRADTAAYLAASVATCVLALLAKFGGAVIGTFLLANFAGAVVALPHR